MAATSPLWITVLVSEIVFLDSVQECESLKISVEANLNVIKSEAKSLFCRASLVEEEELYRIV